MKMNTIRLMLALLAIAITAVITSSERTRASGQKSNELDGKDGHLFLSGMAAGGFYELEPLTIQKRPSSKRGRN